MFENNKLLKPFMLYLRSVGLREVKWRGSCGHIINRILKSMVKLFGESRTDWRVLFWLKGSPLNFKYPMGPTSIFTVGSSKTLLNL